MCRGTRIFTTLLVASLFAACTPMRPIVPPGVVPEARPMTRSSYEQGQAIRQQLVEQFGTVENPAAIRRVRSITDRLLAAAEASPRDWEITILRGDEIQNAAATQGQQLFVWSGMLTSLQSDSQLAAVLSHEIAHVLADHVTPTQEETINRILTGVAGQAAQQLAGTRGGMVGGQLAGSLTATVASGFLVNPYSQRLESEADTIGLFLMADAGFNPRAAVDLWDEFAQREPAGWEFLSTHPNSANRRDQLRQHLDEALERYRRSRRR